MPVSSCIFYMKNWLSYEVAFLLLEVSATKLLGKKLLGNAARPEFPVSSWWEGGKISPALADSCPPLASWPAGGTFHPQLTFLGLLLFWGIFWAYFQLEVTLWFAGKTLWLDAEFSIVICPKIRASPPNESRPKNVKQHFRTLVSQKDVRRPRISQVNWQP